MKKHIYRSKVDVFLFLLVFSSSVFLLYIYSKFMITTAFSLTFIIVTLLYMGILCMLWLPFCNTRYSFEGEHLVIRSLWLTWRVPLQQIESVTPCFSCMSAPALSLQRLEIIYRVNGLNESILISPREREAFCRQLQQNITTQINALD